MLSLFESAKRRFALGPDQEMLKATEERTKDLLDIASLMQDHRAQKLKKSVISDVHQIVQEMRRTKNPDLMYDLDANLKLLEKMSPQAELDGIQQWLNEALND